MSKPLVLKYLTLNVFTVQRYAGNPLAIVRLPSSQHLDQQQKQAIAREFNYSETVILHEGNHGTAEHAIDIFMTDGELPFAGHPTIGTACYLASLSQDPSLSHLGERSQANARNFSLRTKGGLIPCRFDTTLGAAYLHIPHDVCFHENAALDSAQVVATGVPARVAQSLIAPITFVSIVKGVTFALLQLPSIEALSNACGSIDPASLTDANVCLDEQWFEAFLGTKYFVICGDLEDGTIALRTRMFINRGMLEDPATGSASCALCCYLARKMDKISDQRRDDDITFKFEIDQGVDMGRPSKIYVQVTLNGKSGTVKDVVLGGSAVKVMEGTLLV